MNTNVKRSNKTTNTWPLIAGWLAILLMSNACPAAETPPNIVLIFCDDLGYGDIGCFGSAKHRTPNIDRMAAEGMRLTSFNVTCGVCTPSRSSLMTGCYPRRVGMHQNEEGKWVLFPGNSRGLDPNEITIAEILKARGYATAIVGKWHLGDQPEFLPTRQGFDSYFGIPFSNDMGKWKPVRGYPPLPLVRDEEVIETEPDQGLLTPRYTEEAVRFIRANRDAPFFLYFPHTFPHAPLNASPRFRGKSANGLYGDAVEEIDWSTGEILDALQELGIDDRTLVIFTSDNGAAKPFGGSNLPLSGFKASTWEGGMRVPCVMRWPGRIPAGKECSELVTSMDLLPTLAGLSGGKIPTDRVIDGKDVWPLISGQPGAKSPHEAFFYYFVGQLAAVRSGKWKLHIARRLGREKVAAKIPLELYDLENDVAEQHNVAKQHPEIVKRLLALADKCRDDLGDGKRAGQNTRPPGHVDNARPMTHD